MARAGAVTYDDIDDDAQSGASSDGDRDPIEIQVEERLARKVGWVPQQDWDRAPDRWRPASEYLDQHLRRVGELSDELKRSNAAAAAAIDEANARRRDQAEAEVRTAAESGDPDVIVAAAKKLAANTKPPTLLDDWMRRNPWFTSNPEARAVAIAVSNAQKAQGASIPDELDACERRVKQLFPDLFKARHDPDDDDEPPPKPRGMSFGEGDVITRPPRAQAPQPERRGAAPERETGEVRMSEARRPRVVEGGSRAVVAGRPKGKGFADLPKAVQATFDSKFKPRGVDPEKYAASYYKGFEENS